MSDTKSPTTLAEANALIAAQADQLRRLKKINQALIERVEDSGAGGSATSASAPYAAFEHAAVLAEQVRERTAKLSHMSDALRRSNDSLRRANQAARLAHRRLVDAIESISDAFVLFDSEQRIRLFNHRFREYWQDLGLKVEIGMPRTRLQWQAQEYDLVQHWQRDNQSRSRVYQLTNGHWIQLSERLTGDGGRVLLYTDITDLKRSEDRSKQHLQAAKLAAEQANISKTKFLAAVSHDLLQPLNAARLFHGAMQEQPMSAKMTQLVGSASRSLDDVEELLRTLIDISKLDAGVLKADKEPIALPSLLANLDEQHQPLAAHKGRVLNCVAQRVWVMTDAALLSRLLRNLLSNALRYTETGGKVLLGSRRRHYDGRRYVEIQVLDNGSGMDEAALGHIFREFHRLPQARDQSDNGLGLGLAIVDKLSQLLDHPVTVRSSFGAGSVFSVQVPVCAAPEPDALRTVGEVGDSTRGLHVAVIDNDPAVCAAMETLLVGWGYRVSVFHQAPLEVNPFDFVVIDYHLAPGGSVVDAHTDLAAPHAVLSGQLNKAPTSQSTGLEWVHHWRQSTQAPLPPMLMITANHSPELKQALQQAQLPVLYKPVRPVKLRALIQHLAGQAVG